MHSSLTLCINIQNDIIFSKTTLKGVFCMFLIRQTYLDLFMFIDLYYLCCAQFLSPCFVVGGQNKDFCSHSVNLFFFFWYFLWFFLYDIESHIQILFKVFVIDFQYLQTFILICLINISIPACLPFEFISFKK